MSDKDEEMVPIAMTIEQAVKVTGRSRSAIYEDIKNGKLVARKAGSRTLILVSDLTDWLRALPRAPFQKQDVA